MGFLGGSSRIEWEGCKKAPIPKTYYAYPTKKKLGTILLYLRKIQKIYESVTHLFSSAHISNFYQISANFAISRNTNID